MVMGEGLAPQVHTAAKAALPLPDKPWIAVLPFENVSGDPEL
jgi:TolB-like protein